MTLKIFKNERKTNIRNMMFKIHAIFISFCLFLLLSQSANSVNYKATVKAF
jgi:hypothetical protein